MFCYPVQGPTYCRIKKIVHICSVKQSKARREQTPAFFKNKTLSGKVLSSVPCGKRTNRWIERVRNFSSYFEKLLPNDWVCVLNHKHPEKENSPPGQRQPKAGALRSFQMRKGGGPIFLWQFPSPGNRNYFCRVNADNRRIKCLIALIFTLSPGVDT